MREREKKKKPQRLCATKLRLKKKLLLPHWDGPGELCWTLAFCFNTQDQLSRPTQGASLTPS